MTALEEIVTVRLDELIQAVIGLECEFKGMREDWTTLLGFVKKLTDAAVAPPEPILEPILEPIDAGWVCAWPDCGIEVSIDQAELSSRWCRKVLCSQHNAHLKAIREAKKAAAG